ncbi:MAG: serine hydroxymethyltransferase, partial [Vicinamibacteria bacterium]
LGEVLREEGFRLVSGGTDNHLLLVDVGASGITGKEAEGVLDRAGITVNKNVIPFDSRPPLVASGVRVGTPALTSRGMKTAEMKVVGRLIARAIRGREQESQLEGVAKEVKALASGFPLYPVLESREDPARRSRPELA